jgi:hypothetical protein
MNISNYVRCPEKGLKFHDGHLAHTWDPKLICEGIGRINMFPRLELSCGALWAVQ